jgi:hypothetical protein
MVNSPRNLFVAGYATWYLGMVGPVYHVVKATFKEVGKQTKDQLESRGVKVDKILAGTFLEDSSSNPPERTSSMRRRPKTETEEEIELKDTSRERTLKEKNFTM